MRNTLLCLTVLSLAFFFSCEKKEEHPRLLIKMATRARYEQFFFTLDRYYEKLSEQNPYHFVISCDLDDPVMNSPKAIEKFATYPHLSVYYGNNQSKIEACNADIDKHPDFDILILASDDMIPVVEGFDRFIVSLNSLYFPDYSGAIHFNDGCQGTRVNTLPIIGKKYYDTFGYIYNPQYKSFFCDDEMTQVSRLLNKSIYVSQVIIEHHHPSIGNAPNDELYQVNSRFWEQDKMVYNARRSMNFGLEPENVGKR